MKAAAVGIDSIKHAESIVASNSLAGCGLRLLNHPDFPNLFGMRRSKYGQPDPCPYPKYEAQTPKIKTRSACLKAGASATLWQPAGEFGVWRLLTPTACGTSARQSPFPTASSAVPSGLIP